MTYLIILFRSTLFYLLINIFYRLMGKREIGELSIMDFIVSMFIAEVAAISIENYKESILISLIPIIVLVVLQVVFSYITLKNNKFRESVELIQDTIRENEIYPIFQKIVNSSLSEGVYITHLDYLLYHVL